MKKVILILACFGAAQLFGAVDRVDISGLDKKILLNALYQSAQPQGMGFCHYKPNDSLSDDEAEKILKRGYIDYLHGRVMKIDLSGDFVGTRSYNRDNGADAAEMIIEELRKKLNDSACPRKSCECLEEIEKALAKAEALA